MTHGCIIFFPLGGVNDLADHSMYTAVCAQLRCWIEDMEVQS